MQQRPHQGERKADTEHEEAAARDLEDPGCPRWDLGRTLRLVCLPLIIGLGCIGGGSVVLLEVFIEQPLLERVHECPICLWGERGGG